MRQNSIEAKAPKLIQVFMQVPAFSLNIEDNRVCGWSYASMLYKYVRMQQGLWSVNPTEKIYHLCCFRNWRPRFIPTFRGVAFAKMYHLPSVFS